MVLINKSSYYISLERLFSNKLKFEVINDDLTSCNLSAVQNYLNLLFSQREISYEQNREMRSKFSQTGRAHGLPDTHKNFDTLPGFDHLWIEPTHHIIELANF